MGLLAALRRSPSRTPLYQSLSAFGKWLAAHPDVGDRSQGNLGVRYQVNRYCEYLQGNPWTSGDPLRDARARDGAVNAYKTYLETFNTPAPVIAATLVSLDHFYVFLGLGAVNVAHDADSDVAGHA